MPCQENDFTADGAMTDSKGARSKMPHEQADPDPFLDVVERHVPTTLRFMEPRPIQPGALLTSIRLSLCLPLPWVQLTRTIPFFAAPIDAEDIFMIIVRQSYDTRKMEGSELDVGNAEFGGVEALTVSDHMFIPNDRIFLNGETDFTEMMVARFAGYHRRNYGGYKVGLGAVLIGAVALAAEYNGAAKASHIKDKLIEMTHLNETLYCCGIACSAAGYQTASGNFLIDLLLAEDIAGGLMVTAPPEKDSRDSVLRPVIDKYFRGVYTPSTENCLQILRLIENLALGTTAVGYRTESLHGAGSPQAQRIIIARHGSFAVGQLIEKSIVIFPAW